MVVLRAGNTISADVTLYNKKRTVIRKEIAMEKHMKVPFAREEAAALRAGDYVYLTGTIYTARDAAHKRMYETLQKGGSLPFDIRGNVIYYMGPSPARQGRPIGSAGPTTASRMDKYPPALLDLGLQGMIGKGKRTEAVKQAMIRNTAVYFAAVGGAGALLSKSIICSEVIAYEDLGTEAVRRCQTHHYPKGRGFLHRKVLYYGDWRPESGVEHSGHLRGSEDLFGCDDVR